MSINQRGSGTSSGQWAMGAGGITIFGDGAGALSLGAIDGNAMGDGTSAKGDCSGSG